MNVIVIAFILLQSILAPMPPGVAYNPESRECGAYFGGDEFGGYALKDPWVVTYDLEFDTSAGWDAGVQAYCEEIGYTYVPGNMGELYGTHEQSPLYYSLLLPKIGAGCCIAAVVVIGVSLLLRWRKKRKTTEAHEINP